MKLVTVFKQSGIFAGWPANHGHWQWDDEFLVGFMVGPHAPNEPGHKIAPPYTKMLARSMDGGETWKHYLPGVDFHGRRPATPPTFDLSNPNTIIRVCGNYDTGGEDCPHHGAFYLSRDRGESATWAGPFKFEGLEGTLFDEHHWNTSRTCVLGDRVFLSAALRDEWGTDFIFEARHDGTKFHFVGIVDKNSDRCVMPSVAHAGGRTYIAARRKGHGQNWIDVYQQMTVGTWRQVTGEPRIETGWYNGNPPALAAIGSTLYCAYGDRSDKAIRVVRSTNSGMSWDQHAQLNHGLVQDIGYPRLFTRSDGRLVCVYYFSDAGEAQRIEACIFEP